jgi:hypothetical protein
MQQHSRRKSSSGHGDPISLFRSIIVHVHCAYNGGTDEILMVTVLGRYDSVPSMGFCRDKVDGWDFRRGAGEVCAVFYSRSTVLN